MCKGGTGSTISAISTASGPGRTCVASTEEFFKGDFEIVATGTTIEIDSNYNGWGLTITLASSGIDMSVSSRVAFDVLEGYENFISSTSDNSASASAFASNAGPGVLPVLNRNWVFTYTKKILINNY